MILLSILIPTIKRHKVYLLRLLTELNSQIEAYPNQIEILVDDNETDSVGVKRNRLLEKANGKYLCFFDADDTPSPFYISLLMDSFYWDCDCTSLTGMYSVDGKQVGVFEHSIKYKAWKTTDNYIKFERYPNHLNAIRSSIAKRFKFPDKSFSEDFDWSTQIHNSNLIQSEHYIPVIIYYYNYISSKMAYSQNSEEEFIVDYFKDYKEGKFLDIGAFHVYRFSNTRKLYELGWNGILVEPSPQNYKAIADHYKGDERIRVLNVAIGAETGTIDFYESDGDAVSTSEIEHMEKWAEAGVKYSKIKVKQLSVDAFMKLYGKDTDMISIDTEATNIFIFRRIPDWFWERVKLVVIEHDTFYEEIENTLVPFGFYPLYLNAENIILAKG